MTTVSDAPACEVLDTYHDLMLLASMVEEEIPYHIINASRAHLGAFDALFAPIDQSHVKPDGARGFLLTARTVGGHADSLGVFGSDDDSVPQLFVI